MICPWLAYSWKKVTLFWNASGAVFDTKPVVSFVK